MKTRTRTQAQEDRRQRRTRIAMSVFLIVLMVFSTVGFYFSSGSSSTRYNGFKIMQKIDTNQVVAGYEVKVNGKIVPFYTVPTDTLADPLPVGLIDSLKSSKAIMFLFDPNDNQTKFYDQFRFDFSTTVDKPQGAGLTNATTISAYPFPVITCNQATADYPIIRFENGTRGLRYESGCFVVSGTGTDILLMRDRIIYAYYGITKN